MNFDNIVMWTTPISIVDWVYSKTQTLLTTLKTPNQPQVESCVSWEVEYLSPSVGCARSKLLSHTVLQSLKSNLWMLDYAWPALDLWDIVIEVLRSTNNTVKPNHDSIR